MTTTQHKPEQDAREKPKAGPGSLRDTPASAPSGIKTVGLLAILLQLLRFLRLGVARLFGTLRGTVLRVAVFCENWLLDGARAPHGLAVTRIMFGVAGVGLLLSNWSTRLYAFGPGSLWNGEAVAPGSDFPRLWIFSLFRTASTNAAAYTAVYILVLIVAILFTLGWRFKLILPVYLVLWISFIEANDMLGDQGDNMYRIALILLLFADPVRVWSLDARRRRKVSAARKEAGGVGHTKTLPWLVRKWAGEPLLSAKPEYRSLFNNLALVALTAQVCFVYVSGALYKAGGVPWQEGWAVYDPLHTVQFGTWPELSALVTAWGPSVVVAAWGSIVLQLCFPMMLLTHPTRVIALVGIMGFHLGIGVLMGLPWFSLTMIAIDFVFITEKTWSKLIAGTRAVWAKAA